VDASTKVCDRSCFPIVIIAESDSAHYGTVEKIRGFALNPTAGFNKEWVTNQAEYDPSQLARGLTEPCQKTCQESMMPYFRENDCEKCLFRLEHMDGLGDRQKPYVCGDKKGKNGKKPERTKG
jgi:hypothetical protein